MDTKIDIVEVDTRDLPGDTKKMSCNSGVRWVPGSVDVQINTPSAA